MGAVERRDDLLEQIRSLPVEDRDYIEATLMREAYEQGRHLDSAEFIAEIERRAHDALSGRSVGVPLEEALARAQAAVAAVHSRKP